MFVAGPALQRLTCRTTRTLLLGRPAKNAAWTLRASSTRHSFSSCISQSKLRASTSSFSTMATLKSAALPPTGPVEYDTEIKDMASYIHNYNVDSDLAVRAA